MRSEKQRLVLIDGHAALFRAFYAIPVLTTPTGELVNAVYGFALTLLNSISELEPTHILVAFDASAPTFRHTDFAAYKAQRKETPAELKDQLGRVKGVVEALNMPIFEVSGFEADDVIGTLAVQAAKLKGVEAVIVTGDHDALQLVRDEKVLVFMPGRSKKPSVMFDEEEVKKKMGVTPVRVVDLKGLAGDSSDNIPGIKGVGPKTALDLIRKFGSVEGIYKAIADKSAEGQISNTVLKKLAEGQEIALKSKMLATIVTEVPIKLDLDACRVSGYDKAKALALFEELGFKSLMGRLPQDEFEQGVQEALF